MQQTTFPFEVLIHDDASTDGTARIIREYEEKYPDIIKPIYQTENQYSKGIKVSMTYNFPRAQGKYIAMCEGDDYWTDPLKLQKQIDLLEQHPEISISCHPTFWLENNEIKDVKYGYHGDNIKIIEPKQVISNFITAGLQSIVIRNKYLPEFHRICEPPALGGHSAMQLLYGLDGGILYLPDYMATYRAFSSSSVSKTLFKKDKGYFIRQENNLVTIDRINKFHNYIYDKEFTQLKKQRILSFLQSKQADLRTLIRWVWKYNLADAFLGKIKFIKNYYKKF